MMCRRPNRLTWLMLLLMPGCVNLTVNVYFPEPELRAAAEVIESDIRGTVPGSSGGETSVLYECPLPGGAVLAFALRDKAAYAQAERKEIDIDIESPAILKLRESRKKRYKDIKPFLDDGRLGEGLDGYVILRDPKGLELRPLQSLKKLVAAENQDRKALYREIAEAQHLSDDEIERIQEIFAKAIWKTMEPGHYFVKEIDDKGKITWMVKPEPEKKEKK